MIIASLTDGAGVATEELHALYAAVGWSAYTADTARLVRAIEGSTLVVTARAASGQLIGLARAISDDSFVCYLQDVLVHPDLQRSGVGAALVKAVLERFAHVRQQVLLTDDEPGQRAFYEALGFTETRDFGDGRLRAFVRFNS